MNNKYAIECLEQRIRNLVVQKTTSPKGYHKEIDKEISATQQAIIQLKGEVIASGEVHSLKANTHSGNLWFVGDGFPIDQIVERNMELLDGKHISISIHKGEV